MRSDELAGRDRTAPGSQPRSPASSSDGDPFGLEQLVRLLVSIAEAPVARLTFFEGEDARTAVRASAHPVDGLSDVMSARRLRGSVTRVVPQVGHGPAAPEVALFSLDRAPLALISMPLLASDGEQLGAVILADDRARPDWRGPRLEALEQVRAMIECTSRRQLEPHLSPPAEGPSVSSDVQLTVMRRPPSSLRVHKPDALTGLPNREHVTAEAERRIERAAQLGHGLALVLISMDRFRRVNDSLGHATGDQLLRQIAQRLLASIDEDDVLGRRSGDEFIVLLDDLGPSRSALALVDRIQQAIREPFFVEGHELMVTACLGIARYPQDGSDAASLLRFADIALHQAKDEGPGRLKAFDAAMQVSARDRLDLEQQLRDAMRAGQLAVHYQPKYDINTGDPVGAEALLRWTHPARGTMSPARFVPVAEETGLIVPIGTWVLTEVCRQCRKWLEAGIDVGRVSVNVSGLQFTRHDFVGTVTRALRGAGIPSRCVELEITETVLMDDVDTAIRRLGELRKLGVRISIDDFGTGYSSLAYLQKLPIDVLKIDRSFVQDLDREGVVAQQARSLAQAITFLGHQLELKVLAEGVETPAQLEQLSAVGCDEVQGYLFGRPMPPDAFAEHIAKK